LSSDIKTEPAVEESSHITQASPLRKLVHLGMEGKVALVTGANTGIGLETARGLYRQGAHVVLACRNEASAHKAMMNIKASSPGTPASGLEYMHLDLSSLDSVRKFASAFKSKSKPLHVLVNNAGMNSFSVKKGDERTADGFDRIWQVNYLSHFLLTSLLTDSLKKSAPSRVVNLSSVAHRWGTGKFEVYSPGYLSTPMPSNVNAYSDSKLAMALISLEQQRRMAPHDITVHAVNPGACNSDIWRDFPGKQVVQNTLFSLLFLRPNQGAAPSIAAATHPALGDKRSRYLNPYWHPLSRSLEKSKGFKRDWTGAIFSAACVPFDYLGFWVGANEADPAPFARDGEASRRLYDLSAKWVGGSNNQ